jgi:hypothetical protein
MSSLSHNHPKARKPESGNAGTTCVSAVRGPGLLAGRQIGSDEALAAGHRSRGDRMLTGDEIAGKVKKDEAGGGRGGLA